MDTDSSILGFTKGKVVNGYMDLSNLDNPINTNNKVPGKFEHELGSKIIEEFIVIKPKTYSIKNYGAKEKGIKKESNGKHEEYYSALVDNRERIIEESRIQKVGRSMATIKISKRSLSNFDDKRFYVNNIKSYPHDEDLYLFKRDLINKIREAASPIREPVSPIKKTIDRDKNKLIGEATLLINNIMELTINSNRELIEAANRLYNELL